MCPSSVRLQFEANGWHLEDHHQIEIEAIWEIEGLRPLVRKWATTRAGAPGADEVFWELCFAAHLVRTGIAESASYECALGHGLKTVDFKVTDRLYVELTTKGPLGGLPSQGELWDLHEVFADRTPARDLSYSLTKHFNLVRDRQSLLSQLEQLVPLTPPGKSFEARSHGHLIAKITPHEVTYRTAGWQLGARSLQSEQYKTDGGLSKDQAQLREAINHGLDKLPLGFSGCLLIGVACLHGYYALRHPSAMNEMLFEGFSDNDPKSNQARRRFPGLWSEFAEHSTHIRIGVYNECLPQLSVFHGLTIYDLVPRLNVVAGTSERRFDAGFEIIGRSP